VLVEALIETEGFTHVRVLSQDNGGKSVALNNGIAQARGEIVVTVDGDTVFSNDALTFLVQPFREASVGAVSGNTKVANRGGWLGRWQHIEYVMGFNLDRRMYDLLGCMPTVPGAIGAFRASALHDVGGFTHDTLAEDTEITMALHRAGWRVAFEPRAIAWTEAPSRLRDLWRQRYRWSYGTMQSVWKHRGAVVDKGPGRRLGRVGLPYLLCFQVALPLLGPAVDLFTLYGLIFLDARVFALYWIGFTLLQVGVAAYALHLDGETMRPVWAVPFQQFVYRQMMYLVVIQSIASALAGVRVGWHQLRRTGRLEASTR
jgi:cellulose synthase/poly-beta-1,6-N-acetylglucosamine synthase-like glycosyltransferase